MNVLVDSSVWIEYFNQGEPSALDELISENLICTNALILAELIPVLRVQNKVKLINILRVIKCMELEINWDEITDYQIKCIRKGVSGIGLPDLIMAQNSLQNNCPIFALDKHFKKLSKVMNLELYGEN